MVEQLCIDSVLLGTEKHLIVDDGFTWQQEIPKNAWHLSGAPKLHSDRCLDTLLTLNGVELDIFPPSRFVNSMSLILTGSNTPVPWSHVMSTRDHKAFVKKLINSAKDSLATISKDYYTHTWVPQSIILRSLRPAKVSRQRYEAVMAEMSVNSRVVEGFRPGQGGYAAPVVYDRFGTRTGRLTVASGPNVLTLKKDYRDMIVSSYAGGKIAYIDFAALEARVLLYEAGGRCDDIDIYTYINNELFNGAASRRAIKGAVISELYGSSKSALGAALGIHGKELDDFVGKVKGLFKTSDLCKRVKDQFLKTAHITNKYGRRVHIEDPLDHIFVNSYAQSTGVDVSLLGFSEIAKMLAGKPGIRPLFVLHDALIMDVSPENLDLVAGLKEVLVPGYTQSFPLKVEFSS